MHVFTSIYRPSKQIWKTKWNKSLLRFVKLWNRIESPYKSRFWVAPMVKNLPVMQETPVWFWVGKIPWRRKWQATPVFLPGEFHGQRSLLGCIHGVAKSQTQLKWFSSSSSSGLDTKSCPTLGTPQTVACQVPLSMGFSRRGYWSGLPFPSPGDLPDPGIERASPAWQADSLPLSHLGSPLIHFWTWNVSRRASGQVHLYQHCPSVHRPAKAVSRPRGWHSVF